MSNCEFRLFIITHNITVDTRPIHWTEHWVGFLRSPNHKYRVLAIISHMTIISSLIITHGSGGVLPPDEEVEKEAHPKDGARIEGGSQESSLLPV